MCKSLYKVINKLTALSIPLQKNQPWHRLTTPSYTLATVPVIMRPTRTMLDPGPNDTNNLQLAILERNISRGPSGHNTRWRERSERGNLGHK
jgi:hypothetical protein